MNQELYVYIKHGPAMILTYFTTRLILVTLAFYMGKSENYVVVFLNY